jgi:hypothetical protein
VSVNVPAFRRGLSNGCRAQSPNLVCMLLALTSLAGAGCVGQALAEPEEVLRPADFAYGREIQVADSPVPVVSVPLPLDVYRAMRAPDLSELMVFNGRGAQVPYAIRTVRTGTPLAPEMLELPLFPLHVVPPRDGSSGELALEIERDADGRVLRIAAKSEKASNQSADSAGLATKRGTSSKRAAPLAAAGRGSAQSAPDAGVEPSSDAMLQPIAAYILDARGAKRAIVSLQLKLLESADERVLPLRVEASEDLVHFYPLPVEGALVQLGHGGQRIDRDQVVIPATRAPFFRLSALREENLPTPVVRVVATLADLQPARPFEKVVVPAQATSKPQVFEFDLGGPVPVDRIEFQLPENNTIVNAELFASSSRQGPWSSVIRTRLYRIARPEAELTGPTLEIARRNDRYYQLRVEATGGGLGAGTPELVTYHAPDQLLFLRRGEGPFTLAYGRYKVQHARFEADDLLSLLPDQPAPTAVGTLGEAKTLGGKDRLSQPKAPPPYKTYAVWAVLIAGVALLGTLALRLSRTQKS